jgi:hypothetical protein
VAIVKFDVRNYFVQGKRKTFFEVKFDDIFQTFPFTRGNGNKKIVAIFTLGG